MEEKPKPKRGPPFKPAHLRRIRPDFYVLPKTDEAIRAAAQELDCSPGEYLDALAQLVVFIEPGAPTDN